MSSIEKDSIVTTRDSVKYYILACKTRNQMHVKFKEIKVPQAAGGSFARKMPIL